MLNVLHIYYILLGSIFVPSNGTSIYIYGSTITWYKNTTPVRCYMWIERNNKKKRKGEEDGTLKIRRSNVEKKN